VENLFSSLSWWCAAVCYAPVLLGERSPVISDGLYFRWHEAGYVDTVALEFGEFFCLPNGEAATHSEAKVVMGREDLVVASLQYLKSMIQPLMSVAKNHAHLHDKALWLYVADNLATLVLHLTQEPNQQEKCEAGVDVALNQLPERGQTGVLEVRHGGQSRYHLKRSTCCFYYLSPEGKKCATCPKLPLNERLERLQLYMTECVKEAEAGCLTQE
jgi:hypothetical protein